MLKKKVRKPTPENRHQKNGVKKFTE